MEKRVSESWHCWQWQFYREFKWEENWELIIFEFGHIYLPVSIGILFMIIVDKDLGLGIRYVGGKMI